MNQVITDVASILRREAEESDRQIVARIMGRDVTRAELSKAFDRVADKSNWKNSIDIVLDLNDVEIAMIREAVIFFTGSIPGFRPMLGAKLPKCRYRVRAAGYYNAIGA